MALLKLGGVIDKISGKVGGQIFGTGVNGAYMKSNSYSQQHSTPSQDVQRTNIYRFTKLWSSLSNEQKQAWSDEVVNYPYVNRVGDTVYYNAYQLFLWCNAGRNIINYSQLLSPGSYTGLDMPTCTLYNVGSSSIYNGFAGSSSNLLMVLYATQPQNDGVTPKKALFKYQISQSIATGGTNFSVLYSSMQDMSVPTIGQYFWCYYRIVNGLTGATAGFSPILKMQRTS